MRSKTYIKLFYEEFDAMMKVQALKHRSPSPEILQQAKMRHPDEIYLLGIKESIFDRLNNSFCRLWRGQLMKAQYDAYGTMIGTQEIKRPTDSVPIVSAQPIQITPNYEAQDSRYTFVNVITQQERKYYIYTVPKDVCYKYLHESLLPQQMFKPSYFRTGFTVADVPLPSKWTDRIQEQIRSSEESCNIAQDGSIIYRKSKRKSIHIEGISEAYYDKLNNSDCYVWEGDLIRRLYDSGIGVNRDKKSGKLRKEKKQVDFLRDKKTGEILVEKVTKPSISIAILSEIRIGVPNKKTIKIGTETRDVAYTTEEEGFMYIDFIVEDGKVYYIYTVPKHYCYQNKQTALILSPMSGRSAFYYGRKLAFKSGDYFRLLVIDYSPSLKSSNNYRILTTGTNIHYELFIKQLEAYWRDIGYIYDSTLCPNIENVEEAIAMTKIPFLDLVSNSEARLTFEQYDLDKPLSAKKDEYDMTDMEVIDINV